MNKNTIIAIVLIVLVLAGVGYLAFTRKSVTLVNTVTYECDAGKVITADFFQGPTSVAAPNMPPTPTGRVELTFSDASPMSLPQVLSANGARYANSNQSFVFWIKGNGAQVLENGDQVNYTNCVDASTKPDSSTFPQAYSSATYGFALRLPAGYTTDEKYTYQPNPQTKIPGVKFTIPKTLADGTNLSTDSYISIEKLTGAINSCSAEIYLDQPTSAGFVDQGGHRYSVALSIGAGAGNRYEEIVYATPVDGGCLAVRYFIHYGVFENYPAGSITQFDEQALRFEFDAIRESLVIN